MVKVSKGHYIKYFGLSFVAVFLFNMILNNDFSSFVGFLYGDINSTINMDITMFIKILIVLIGETSIISGIFYYISKALL